MNNKEKEIFFALYIGQHVMLHGGKITLTIDVLNAIDVWDWEACLLLKNLSAISDEDAVDVAKIILPLAFERRTKGWEVIRDYAITGYPYIKIRHKFVTHEVQIDTTLVNFDVDSMEDRVTGQMDMKPCYVIDFLRSRGYLLPFQQYSCDDLISMGWVKIDEK